MSVRHDPLPPDRQELEAFWMPFTANRQFKAAPRLLARAEGMHYWTADGRRILDATAGLWCLNAGHCRKPIVEAIAQAAGSLVARESSAAGGRNAPSQPRRGRPTVSSRCTRSCGSRRSPC